MSSSKSYLLSEIVKLLKEKNQQFPQDINVLYQQFSQEPRYLLIPGGGVVDLHNKTGSVSIKRRDEGKNRRFFSLYIYNFLNAKLY